MPLLLSNQRTGSGRYLLADQRAFPGGSVIGASAAMDADSAAISADAFLFVEDLGGSSGLVAQAASVAAAAALGTVIEAQFPSSPAIMATDAAAFISANAILMADDAALFGLTEGSIVESSAVLIGQPAGLSGDVAIVTQSAGALAAEAARINTVVGDLYHATAAFAGDDAALAAGAELEQPIDSAGAMAADAAEIAGDADTVSPTVAALVGAPAALSAGAFLEIGTIATLVADTAALKGLETAYQLVPARVVRVPRRPNATDGRRAHRLQ